jgi:hypothetical protein
LSISRSVDRRRIGTIIRLVDRRRIGAIGIVVAGIAALSVVDGIWQYGASAGSVP